MYKIEIDWDFRSPSLGVLTGKVKIGHIQMGLLDENEFPSFHLKKERNTLGYKRCPAIFQRTKPLVDLMVRSYYDGMLMRKESMEWFTDCSRVNNSVYLTMPD
jgi:hypothetical protein